MVRASAPKAPSAPVQRPGSLGPDFARAAGNQSFRLCLDRRRGPTRLTGGPGPLNGFQRKWEFRCGPLIGP